MGRGDATVARCIWQHRGSRDFADWFVSHPDEVVVYRRVLLGLASGIVRRHGSCFKAPLNLVMLADDRCPDDKLAMIQEFVAERGWAPDSLMSA